MIAALQLYSAFQHRGHYYCLLEVSGFLGRQQQPLAEAQYSGKFVRILVMHPVLSVFSGIMYLEVYFQQFIYFL